MAEYQDIRWLQRFDSYKKALAKLASVTETVSSPSDLSELEQSGLIQWFEFTYELAWKVMQDLLEYKGYDFMKGPNGTLREAFSDGMIGDQDEWRQMAKDRTLMSHTYDEDDAKRVVEQIFTTYYPILKKLKKTLEEQQKSLNL